MKKTAVIGGLVLILVAFGSTGCSAKESKFTVEGTISGGDYGRLEVKVQNVIEATGSLKGYLNDCPVITVLGMNDGQVYDRQGQQVELVKIIKLGAPVVVSGHTDIDWGLIFDRVVVKPLAGTSGSDVCAISS